ncbi:MAG: hypothetical protein ABIY52_12640 [Gemmatimonadaceae bacterium]
MIRSSVLAIACASLLVASACDGDDAPHMAEGANRLVGSWDVVFHANPGVMHGRADSVAGSLAFAENRFGPRDMRELEGITDQGVYDLDFLPLGFATRDPEASPVAVARVAAKTAAGVDSLYVVLDPEGTRIIVRLSGILRLDSASGTWTATSFSSGGGSGTFAMWRHSQERTR